MITRQLLTATITLKWNKWTNISLLRRYHVGKEIIYTWVYTLVFLVSKSGMGRYEVTISVLLQWQIWCWVQNVVVNLRSPLNILLFWWWGEFCWFSISSCPVCEEGRSENVSAKVEKITLNFKFNFQLRTVSGHVKHSFSIAYFQFHLKHFAKEWFNVTFHPTGDQFLTV